MNKQFIVIKTTHLGDRTIWKTFDNEHQAIANAQEKHEESSTALEVVELNLSTYETKAVWNTEEGGQ